MVEKQGFRHLLPSCLPSGRLRGEQGSRCCCGQSRARRPWGVLRRPPPSESTFLGPWPTARPPKCPLDSSRQRDAWPGPLNLRPHTPLCPPTAQPECGHHGVRVGQGGGTVCCHLGPLSGLPTREKWTDFITLEPLYIWGFLHQPALEMHLTNHTKCSLKRHTGHVLKSVSDNWESAGGMSMELGNRTGVGDEAGLQQAECQAPSLARRTSVAPS